MEIDRETDHDHAVHLHVNAGRKVKIRGKSQMRLKSFFDMHCPEIAYY
jgi:hypothetical protein